MNAVAADSGKAERILDQVVRQIEHLPTLPQVVKKVLALVESENINAASLSKVMDQSLATKVLKMANSAYYGGRLARTVSSLPHAIVVIGFDAVKEIILTASLLHTFHDNHDVKTLQPLWEHSLECALVAKRLAWIYRYEALDEAYFAGLVHDIGKLAIQQYFSDYYRKIAELTQKGMGNLEAEETILGCTHTEIGRKMAIHWDFPDMLVDVLAHHHDQKWEMNPTLGRILHLADQFVTGALSFPGLLSAFKEAGLHHPAVWDSSDIEMVKEILEEEIKKARSMLQFSSNLA